MIAPAFLFPAASLSSATVIVPNDNVVSILDRVVAPRESIRKWLALFMPTLVPADLTPEFAPGDKQRRNQPHRRWPSDHLLASMASGRVGGMVATRENAPRGSTPGHAWCWFAAAGR